jgi:outer membrane lipoprotein-sorting protein
MTRTLPLPVSLPAVLFLFSVFSANARENAPDVFRFPLGTETLARYGEVSRTLAEHPVVTGTFTQTRTLSRVNRTMVSSGEFIIAAGTGMVWDTRAPFPSVMAVGRDYIVQSTPRGTRTRLEARGNETFLSLADTISAVFTGDAHRLQEDFDNYFTESAGSWFLGLIPREKTVRTFAAQITMSGDSVIRSITLREQNGDTVRYELSGHRFPESLTPDEKALFSVE